MYNRRYDKVFLMLRQETAGYAVGKRPPWGSCIMELKNGTGRLMLTVQGLRPLRYAVYLLAGQESIFCGELHPEKKEGHAELKWAFNPDAVGEGKRAEDFHTVLILAEEGGCSVPLAAYFGEKTDWKAIFQPQKKAEPPKKEKPQEMPKLQEKIDLKAEKTTALSEQKAEPPEAQEKPLSAQGCHGSFQGLLAKFRRELENLEETGVLSAEETANIRAAGKTENPPVKEGGQCADTGTERVDKTTEIVDKADTSGQQKDTLGQQKKLEPFGGWCPLGLSFSGGADPARTNSAEMAEGIFLPAPLQKISSSDSAAGGKRLLARSAGGIQRGGGSRGTALRVSGISPRGWRLGLLDGFFGAGRLKK